MAKKKKSIKTFLTPYLRRASLSWPARNEAFVLARSSRGNYRCAMCQLDFKRDEVHLDHIEPVISLKDGFTTFDDYINKLFCPVEGFQVICSTCHDSKTLIEDVMRMSYKASAVKELDHEEILPDLKKERLKRKKKGKIDEESEAPI